MARTMRAMPPFELGLYTFGDITPELGGVTAQQRLLDVIDEARLAQVEAAESVLAELGFRQFRVRHHETISRTGCPCGGRLPPR